MSPDLTAENQQLLVGSSANAACVSRTAAEAQPRAMQGAKARPAGGARPHPEHGPLWTRASSGCMRTTGEAYEKDTGLSAVRQGGLITLPVLPSCFSTRQRQQCLLRKDGCGPPTSSRDSVTSRVAAEAPGSFCSFGLRPKLRAVCSGTLLGTEAQAPTAHHHLGAHHAMLTSAQQQDPL